MPGVTGIIKPPQNCFSEWWPRPDFTFCLSRFIVKEAHAG
jgi:hypothetical protein